MKTIRTYTALMLLCIAAVLPLLVSCDTITGFFFDDTYELVIHNGCSRYILVAVTSQRKDTEPTVSEKIDVSSYILLQDFEPQNCRLWYRLNTDIEWQKYDFPPMDTYTSITVKYDDANSHCYIAQ